MTLPRSDLRSKTTELLNLAYDVVKWLESFHPAPVDASQADKRLALSASNAAAQLRVAHRGLSEEIASLLGGAAPLQTRQRLIELADQLRSSRGAVNNFAAMEYVADELDAIAWQGGLAADLRERFAR